MVYGVPISIGALFYFGKCLQKQKKKFAQSKYCLIFDLSKRKKMTTFTIIETLAAIKNVTSFEIKNIDTAAGTFQMSKGVYSYEMTASGKYVKTGSVKFVTSISTFKNCSY